MKPLFHHKSLIEWEHIEELEEKRLEKEKELERKPIQEEKEIAKQNIELVNWKQQVKQKLEEFLKTELNKVPDNKIVHCLVCQCLVKKINLRKHVINVHLKDRYSNGQEA